MDLFLTRRHFKKTYTIGRFLIEKDFLCSTLEDPVRPLIDYNNDGDFNDPGEGKIYGETAIPYGIHEVIVSYSPSLKRRTPEILNVQGFTYIRIHALSSAAGTLGCVGVGENVKPGRLVNGPYYEQLLVKKIDEATARGEKTWITIR